MAKITRKTQKIFADSAAASQLTAFGSIKENSPNPPVYTKDPDTIQTNEYLNGWSGATQDDYAPYRQDMNALQYLFSRQIAYLMQAGIPEYDSATQYYANCSFCQINGVVYLCIQDALNKLPTTEPTYWKEIDFSKFAPKNSPAFTGTPTAPTPLTSDDSTTIATTAFIKAVLGGYAPLSSPALTGTPTAPTASAGNNSTQIATTAFVQSAMSQASINMPLFHHFWSDYEVNDTNFLRADTFSWQDGTAYNGPYDHLVDDISGKSLQSETVEGITIQFYEADDGHKIAPASEEANVLALYTMSGVAWYYVLDTVNQRFKLPRKNPDREKLITLMRAKGNGIALGLTNGNTNYGLGSSASGGYSSLDRYTSLYGSSVGTSVSRQGLTVYESYGVTTDSTKSGIVINPTDSDTVFAGKKYLYFYVGNFTQTAIENTAGLNASLFNGKADTDLNNVSVPHLVSRTVNADGITIEEYSDGYVCMRGYSHKDETIGANSGKNIVVNLPITMRDTDYDLYASKTNSTGGQYAQIDLSSGRTSTSQITLKFYNISSATSAATVMRACWEVKGYKAS